MTSEFSSPSQKTIDFLYKGVIAFYPDVAKSIFLLGKAQLPYLSKWGGFERLEFLDLVLKTTQSDSIENAASVIKNWHDGKGLDKTIPSNLNELVEDLDKANQTKNEYEKRLKAKQTLFESEKINIQPKGETPIDGSSKQTDIPEVAVRKAFQDTVSSSQGKDQPKIDSASKATSELKSDSINEINNSDEFTLGINIAKSDEPDPQAFQSFAPLRSNIFYATKEIAKDSGGTVAAGLNLWAQGISATQLETKIQSKFPELDPKHAKKIENVIKVIQGLETDPIKTNLARAAFPVKDIDILLSSRSGVTQTEVAVFFNPVSEGSSEDGIVYQQGGSFFKNLISSAGQQLFGFVAKKSTEKALGTTLKAAAAKVALKIGTKVVGQAAATAAAPVVGNIIVYIGTEILEKIISKLKDLVSKIKENSKEFVIAGIALFAGGAFMGSAALMGAGAGLGGLGAVNGGLSGIKGVISGIGSSIAGLFSAVVLPSVGVPLLIGIISIPVLVAILLFIINSGAYIVPPSPSTISSAVESPYIGIEKTVSTDCMNKAGCPSFGTVTYKIKITAKKGVLSNIKLSNKYSTSCRSGNKTFPNPNVHEISSPPETISPTGSYEFEYTADITSSFDNCLIIDTVEITADTPEKPAVTAAASASVSVGNPPEECPKGWPVDGSFPLTQGPGGSFSHRNAEAIDIATYPGVNVKATHSGTAKVVYTNGAYRPAYVDVISSCGGKQFTTRFAHLSAVSVRDGQRVTMGQSIGATGSDGTGPHLHYEFRGLKMTTPYIPKTVQYGCSGACGSIP